MNVKRMLFPTDFSHNNDKALDYAFTLAAETGALLYIVHVDEGYDLVTALGGSPYLDRIPYESDDRRERHDSLSNVVPTIPGVRYEHHYLLGSPTAEIIKFAIRERVDLIVMGSHGRSGVLRLLMGSIAEGVMRRAPCPVLVIKQPIAAPEPVDDASSHVLRE